MLNFYLRSALSADRIIQPCRDSVVRSPEPVSNSSLQVGKIYQEGIVWFATESATLLALITFAADHGYGTFAWQLAWACTTFFRRSGRWQERASVHRIAVVAAHRSGDRIGKATSLRHLGPAVSRLGQLDEALGYLSEAAKMFDELDDEMGAVSTHLACCRVLQRQGNYTAALGHAQQAWGLVGEGASIFVQADVLTAMGKQLSLLDRQREALPLCEEALSHYVIVGHEEGQADVLIVIGEIEQRLGRHARAVPRYQRSLELDRLLGDRYWEAVALEHLGDAQLEMGDHKLAEVCWREAMTIFRGLRHSDADRVQVKLDAQMP
jgi:tetratricopeptide (TPR) repeat protein